MSLAWNEIKSKDSTPDSVHNCQEEQSINCDVNIKLEDPSDIELPALDELDLLISEIKRK